MTAVGIHPNVDVRELGQQIGKAGEKPTVRERRRHLNSDDFQSGALLAAQPDIARGSAQPAYALSYGAGIFGPVRGRSEERRVGKECVSTWRSRGAPDC